MLPPATYHSLSSIAMNPLEKVPFPIAFGGPGAITVTGTGHHSPLLHRRRRCATSITITCQSSSSPDT
jgi:hypothetical protein